MATLRQLLRPHPPPPPVPSPPPLPPPLLLPAPPPGVVCLCKCLWPGGLWWGGSPGSVAPAASSWTTAGRRGCSLDPAERRRSLDAPATMEGWRRRSKTEEREEASIFRHEIPCWIVQWNFLVSHIKSSYFNSQHCGSGCEQQWVIITGLRKTHVTYWQHGGIASVTQDKLMRFHPLKHQFNSNKNVKETQFSNLIILPIFRQSELGIF